MAIPNLLHVEMYWKRQTLPIANAMASKRFFESRVMLYVTENASVNPQLTGLEGCTHPQRSELAVPRVLPPVDGPPEQRD